MEKKTGLIQILPQWKCVDDQPDHNRRLHYSRFALSPLLVDQAMTIGVAIRRALLSEVEGISIISANIIGAIHEYSTLDGVRESVDEILLNLKQIVVKGAEGASSASIFAQGPGVVTAEHIKFPSSILAVDPDQPIATLLNETQLCIELFIQQGIAKQLNRTKNAAHQGFFIDANFTPVQKANFSIHSVGDPKGLQQLLLLEIWTNKTLTPTEALYQAHASLLNLFQKISPTNSNISKARREQPSVRLKSYTDTNMSSEKEMNDTFNKESLSIDELELSPRISNCLKRANIHTIADLLNYTQEDLLKIKNFGRKSVEQVCLVLRKRFNLELLSTK
uniref:DNA-directed RNA polymerase subunit alpha n=1 Tax=Micrasterias rotata TaxID=130981 RepID=A0A7M2BUB2_9VIRI|nr:RNA polymerase alpha subunit [Micrasterias rotata]